MKLRFTLASILTFTAVSLANLPADTFTPGMALVYFTQDMETPEVTMVDGIAHLGIPELDRLANEFGVFKIEKVFHNAERPENPELVPTCINPYNYSWVYRDTLS